MGRFVYEDYRSARTAPDIVTGLASDSAPGMWEPHAHVRGVPLGVPSPSEFRGKSRKERYALVEQ
jgi:hypothetical protein